MRNFKSIAVLSALIAAGCATGPTVRVDKDPSANLADYKTFAFYDQVATDRARYSSIMSARLKEATREQLERLGYVYDENSPQLRVNFFLNITDKQEIRASTGPGGFYHYRAGSYRVWSSYPYDVDTVEYKAGTLSIDLVDAKNHALVWQGIAEGKVPRDAVKNPDATVDSVVADIFKKFPGTTAT
jgi:hypothetical protein